MTPYPPKSPLAGAVQIIIGVLHRAGIDVTSLDIIETPTELTAAFGPDDPILELNKETGVPKRLIYDDHTVLFMTQIRSWIGSDPVERKIHIIEQLTRGLKLAEMSGHSPSYYSLRALPPLIPSRAEAVHLPIKRTTSLERFVARYGPPNRDWRMSEFYLELAIVLMDHAAAQTESFGEVSEIVRVPSTPMGTCPECGGSIKGAEDQVQHCDTCDFERHP